MISGIGRHISVTRGVIYCLGKMSTAEDAYLINTQLGWRGNMAQSPGSVSGAGLARITAPRTVGAVIVVAVLGLFI
jgi:hypothetical protein